MRNKHEISLKDGLTLSVKETKRGERRVIIRIKDWEPIIVTKETLLKSAASKLLSIVVGGYLVPELGDAIVALVQGSITLDDFFGICHKFDSIV